MSDLMNYLDWRGDLSFNQSAFNEVDHLILSQIAYVNFDGIVPGIQYDESVTLEAASELFFKMNDEKEILKQKSFIKMAPILMKKMAQTRRFSQIRLCKYVNQIDYEAQKQFSVIQMLIEDDTIYVAFRGTDDTLVGWKEDFNMSFMTSVPAQLEAVRYFNEVLGKTDKKIRAGGHSKGGNLAIYAAVKCNDDIKKRILEVSNHDGPGFSEAVTSGADYQKMLGRIRTIIPESSIIGMLLEHKEECIVVKSRQIGIMQHDAMSWKVLGNHFVYSEETSRGSQILDEALKAWVNGLTTIEREQFIDVLFKILESTGAKTIPELTKAKLVKAGTLLKSYNAMDDTTKEMLGKTIKHLTNEYYRVVRFKLAKKPDSIEE